MIRRPPRSTQSRSSAASDVYKRQVWSLRYWPMACSWVRPKAISAGRVQLIAFNVRGNNMQKIIFKSALVLLSALTAPFSLAQDVAPNVLLKAVTLEVIAIIRQDKDIQAGNPAKVADLVETRILPLFDFTRMTQIAVARNWPLALSLIHISEPTRLGMISYAVFCLQK